MEVHNLSVLLAKVCDTAVDNHSLSAAGSDGNSTYYGLHVVIYAFGHFAYYTACVDFLA